MIWTWELGNGQNVVKRTSRHITMLSLKKKEDLGVWKVFFYSEKVQLKFNKSVYIIYMNGPLCT
jgi:hypothetical protein